MGDVEIGEPEIALQVVHELENLGPHAHVEHRDGFVGDDELGTEDDRPGEHGALLLATGEVARVLAKEAVDGYEADTFERLADELLHQPVVAGDAVDAQRVADRLEDGHRRIERSVRILEDELHPLAQRPEAPLRQVGDLLPVERDRPFGDLHQREHRPRQGRLATSRLADQSEHLAAAQLEAHAVDRFDRSRVVAEHPLDEVAPQREVNLHIAHVEKDGSAREVRLRRQCRSPRVRAGRGHPRSCCRKDREASTPRGGPGAPPYRSAGRRRRPASPGGSAGGTDTPTAVRRGRAARRV